MKAFKQIVLQRYSLTASSLNKCILEVSIIAKTRDTAEELSAGLPRSSQTEKDLVDLTGGCLDWTGFPKQKAPHN